MNWQLVVGPLVGCLIGAVTNGIAIKMLFRPLNPVYLWGHRLPLTPGLIPKERPRLAKAVGEVVSGELLSSDVVGRALEAPELLEKIRDLVDRAFRRVRESDKTVIQELGTLLGEEGAQRLVENAETEVSVLLAQRLADFSLGEDLIREALNRHFAENPPGTFMKYVVDGRLIDSLSASLGKRLDRVVSANAGGIVDRLVRDQLGGLLEQEVGPMAEKYESRLPELRERAVAAYLQLVRNDLPRILKTLDLARIVEQRILSYDVADLEGMVRGVAKKELNAIVWFGALLGFVMGFLTAIMQF